MSWTAGNTTAALNLRRGYGTDMPVIKVIPKDSAVEAEPLVSAVHGGLGWIAVRYQGLLGFAASQYVKLASTPAVIGHPRRVGLHFAGASAPAGILDLASGLHGDNRWITSATICNDAGFLRNFRAVSPRTYIVWRPNVGAVDANPLADGQWVDPKVWLEKHWAEIEPHRGWFDAVQLANEFYNNQWSVGEVQRYGEWYAGLAVEADRRGVKVTVGDFAVGVVELDQWQYLDNMLRYAAANGHPLNYHMYSSPKAPYDMAYEAEYYAMRWLFPAALYPALRVIGGEAGAGNWDQGIGHMDSARMRVMWAQVDTLIQEAITRRAIREAQIIGANWFTLAGFSDWIRFGFDLAAYKQYMLS